MDKIPCWAAFDSVYVEADNFAPAVLLRFEREAEVAGLPTTAMLTLEGARELAQQLEAAAKEAENDS